MRTYPPPLWPALLGLLLTTSLTFAQPPTPPTAPAVPMVPDTSKNPVAVVDGEVITRGDLESHVEDVWAGRILLKMIEDRLMWREARRQKVKVTTEELDKAIVAEKSDYPTEQAFQASLRDRGLSPEGYRLSKHRELVLAALRRLDAGVSDFSAQRYYDQHLEDFTIPTKLHLHQIVAGTVDDAYAARERIKRPQDFAIVAADVSPDSPADRGWLTQEELGADRVWEAAVELEVNEVSDPVASGGAFHILMVSEKQEGGLQPYSEVKEEIKQQLGQGRLRSEDGYLRMLLRRAKVDVKWESSAWVKQALEDRRQIMVTIDGERLRLTKHPLRLEDGSILIPAKPVLLALGADLKWDAATKALTATKGDHSITVMVGASWATVDGRDGAIKKVPRMVDGNLYLGPRLVVEALGGSLEWDGPEYTLVIQSQAAK